MAHYLNCVIYELTSIPVAVSLVVNQFYIYFSSSMSLFVKHCEDLDMHEVG
jgi:hypothetical protein